MRARALLVVELGPNGRSAVREMRSQSPLALLPRRGTAAGRDPAVTVHLVGSASTPLAGDDVELDVRVGPGADLVLTGVAAAVALPGGDRPSRLTMRFDVGAGASLQYLPEPTVVTSRADHRSALGVTLGSGARLRCREVLVAGRSGEGCGRYLGSTRVTGHAGPDSEDTVLFAQTQQLGHALLQDSAAHLAGRRVLATETLFWGVDPETASAGDWWSLTPLAKCGSLATAVGPDAVTTRRHLDAAVRSHPGWAACPR